MYQKQSIIYSNPYTHAFLFIEKLLSIILIFASALLVEPLAAEALSQREAPMLPLVIVSYFKVLLHHLQPLQTGLLKPQFSVHPLERLDSP
ncbi:MAG: hypothetical protein ACK5L0_04465 [Candidatus Fimivivens sp.]